MWQLVPGEFVDPRSGGLGRVVPASARMVQVVLAVLVGTHIMRCSWSNVIPRGVLKGTYSLAGNACKTDADSCV